MARDDPHFRLRLPQDLKNQIEEAADAHERSINAEIVARLNQTFKSPEELEREQDEHIAFVQKTMQRGYDLVIEKIGILPDLEAAIDALIEAQPEPRPGKMAVVRLLVRDKLAELGFYKEPKLTTNAEANNADRR